MSWGRSLGISHYLEERARRRGWAKRAGSRAGRRSLRLPVIPRGDSMSATVSAAARAASASLAAALADPAAGAALAAVEGLGLGAGLIIAIGAQNAYVLRPGLRRQTAIGHASCRESGCQ